MNEDNSKHLANIREHAISLRKIANMYEELELIALKPGSNLPPILDAMGVVLCENLRASGNLIDLTLYRDKEEVADEHKS